MYSSLLQQALMFVGGGARVIRRDSDNQFDQAEATRPWKVASVSSLLPRMLTLLVANASPGLSLVIIPFSRADDPLRATLSMYH